MSSLEAAARGGAATLFVLLGLLLVFGAARHRPQARLGGLLALSVAAYVVTSAPFLEMLPLIGAPWLAPLRLASIGVPALIWLFAKACFDDAFRLSWHHALPWLAAILVGAVCMTNLWPSLWWLNWILSLGFVAAACWQAAAGRSTDLVEGRRRFRLVLFALTATYAVVVMVTDLPGMRPPLPSSSAGLINALGLLAMAALVSGVHLTVRSDNLGRPPAVPVSPLELATLPPSSATAAVTDQPPPSAPSPEEEAEALRLLARLRRLMVEEKIYREEGLTVASLAERLDVPQYRLRQLINQRLGHRNFSTFVNGYRLKEARAALADPVQADVPVLTIALDAGFQSIGPFNRAFKAHAGMTPTEFRRAHLAGSPLPLADS